MALPEELMKAFLHCIGGTYTERDTFSVSGDYMTGTFVGVSIVKWKGSKDVKAFKIMVENLRYRDGSRVEDNPSFCFSIDSVIVDDDGVIEFINMCDAFITPPERTSDCTSEHSS